MEWSGVEEGVKLSKNAISQRTALCLGAHLRQDTTHTIDLFCTLNATKEKAWTRPMARLDSPHSCDPRG